jgi:serine/threonine protein kinase
VLSKTGRL